MNPLLAPSPLPYGFPDFAAIREEHFAEAFDVAMAEQRAELAAITAQPGPPTFDDTVVALERSGATLRRVSAVFFVLVGSLSTPGIRETEARVAPLLAASGPPTSARCVRTSSWSGCCTTGCSPRRGSCMDCASPSGSTCPCTTRTCGCFT